MKHAIIQGAVDEDGTKPNPAEHPWMWRSVISDLDYDYDNIQYATIRSLRIDYPASSGTEHVRFVEGDHFGWDDHASWRDGLGFHWYIDDINKLDLSYGYVYFGGYDYTNSENPVTHKWYMTTISGSLTSGWNSLSLTFLYSDDLTWTDASDDSIEDPRRLYTINFKTIGFVFRGKGQSMTMNIDGFHIERNHFEHSSAYDRGLYLHDHDILKFPIGELDFHSGTIEFFIRPDWNWDGRDIYSDFKHRSLFHFSNVANDMLGAVVSTNGLEIYYGNVSDDFNSFVIPSFDFSIVDEIMHMAFVFSNDGKGIGSDSSTLRVYINNVIVAKSTSTWTVSDDKHFYFIFGGQGLLMQKMQSFNVKSSAVDGVVSNLKVHNYCKTDFTDSVGGYDELSDTGGTLLSPSKFIAISTDNVTFHRVGSDALPFYFEKVADGSTIPIYVKVELPDGLTGYEKRTSGVVGSWDIGV